MSRVIRKGIRSATVTRQGIQWCVAWRTEMMPCCAFWYFDTVTEAQDAADQINRVGRWAL